VLSALHALGAGSDSKTLWLRIVVLSPIPAIAYLLVLRIASSKPAASTAVRGAGPHANRPQRTFDTTSRRLRSETADAGP